MYVINCFEKQDYLFTVNTNIFYSAERAGGQAASSSEAQALRSLPVYVSSREN